jgi:predicted ABC-type ATPase
VASSATTLRRNASIFVLAGCNGAGKSSIGGAALIESGIAFYNPDEAARRIALRNSSLIPAPTLEELNAAAWTQGRVLLERAIAGRLNLAFESTLGGQTITELLEKAADQGIAVHVWFVGLATVALHLERVRRRVAKGGHDIPDAKIRERFDRGRVNLVRLLPRLTTLRLYDNSAEADPDRGASPAPRLLLHCQDRTIVEPAKLETLLTATPAWAKPAVAAALKLHLQRRR